MYFDSLAFAAFVFLVGLVVMLLAPATRARPPWSRYAIAGRNGFLLFASYLFYAAWDWRFLGLIVVSTLVDYSCGLGLERTQLSTRGRRARLWVSVCANLGILGTFKYADFFVDSAAALIGSPRCVAVASVPRERAPGGDQLLHLPDAGLHDRPLLRSRPARRFRPRGAAGRRRGSATRVGCASSTSATGTPRRSSAPSQRASPRARARRFATSGARRRSSLASET